MVEGGAISGKEVTTLPMESARLEGIVIGLTGESRPEEKVLSDSWRYLASHAEKYDCDEREDKRRLLLFILRCFQDSLQWIRH